MSKILEKIGIAEFLDDNPGMVISPYHENKICLQGKLYFNAEAENGKRIEDSYEIRILIPEDFPNHKPCIKELGNKITAEIANFHLFRNGCLCLGSPHRINEIIRKNPTVTEYVQKCVVPYLYAISLRIRYGGDLVFGELEHGIEGIADDYLDLSDPLRLQEAIQLIRLKKRISNKKTCPCGCGKRLGVCDFHNKINDLRRIKYLFRKINPNNN